MINTDNGNDSADVWDFPDVFAHITCQSDPESDPARVLTFGTSQMFLHPSLISVSALRIAGADVWDFPDVFALGQKTQQEKIDEAC